MAACTVNCPLCSQPTLVRKTIGEDRRRECIGCGHRFTTTEVLKADHQRLEEVAEDVRALAEKLPA